MSESPNHHDTDPVARVLARIDALLHDLGVRGTALQEVRDIITAESGRQTGGSSDRDRS